jgi:uncharacterized membrane protein YhaH (DUF805 family)
MFFLFTVIVSVVLAVIDGAMGLMTERGIGALGLLYTLAVLLPSIAVGVRRFHDVDKGGWWLLIALVPLIGAIVLLVFTVMEGTRGDNRFGPDPKADEDGVPAMA